MYAYLREFVLFTGWIYYVGSELIYDNRTEQSKIPTNQHPEEAVIPVD